MSSIDSAPLRLIYTARLSRAICSIRLESRSVNAPTFVITGVIGVHGSKRNNARDGRAPRPLIGAYLGFSITSTVFALIIIAIYSIGVANMNSCRKQWIYDYERSNQTHNRYGYILVQPPKECNVRVALGSLVITFAAFELFGGILASVCACTNGCCTCPTARRSQQPTQLGQVIHVQTQQGPQAYIMTQGANGVPVAVPAMVPGQLQMSAVPDPEAMYPSPAGAQGGGAQGGSTHDVHKAPYFQTESTRPAYLA
ncbi:hypothetical protein AC249_AIPGENE20306 [Exaiptasia diaphana]|nr:hypothetical protein AC249_AIPGENE20306 [Exaiptasia diaphana]